MYNVFTDFHHAGLLNSLILLFEKRLGGNVYRPIGYEWHKLGFWSVYNHPATVEQFLTKAQGFKPIDGTPPLNVILDEPEDGVYYCQDIDSGRYNKAIDFDAFLKKDIDIVIATIPHHIESFKRLVRDYKPNAKLIYQIGNSWTTGAGLAPNIMASAIIADIPENINFISYHQEFDLNIFKPAPAPSKKQKIASFVNLFSVDGQFAFEWSLFEELEKSMSGWEFKSYGGQCRDGCAHGTEQVAEFIRECRFVWHAKPGGDGYGHIIHNAAACGIPMITKAEFYRGKFGEKLMIDGITSINIDNLSIADIQNKIKFYHQDDEYNKMRQNIIDNFKKVVDFEREFIDLKSFLNRLQ